MTEIEFNRLVLQSRNARDGKELTDVLQKIIAEAKRARELVQCCYRDNDFDGNCKMHHRKIPILRIVPGRKP